MNKEKSEKSADICTSRCRSDHVLPVCYHFSPCFQLNLSSHLASPGQWQVAMQNTTRPSKILSTGRLVTSSFKSSPASLESSFKDPFWAKIGNKIWTKIRNWKQNLKKKQKKKNFKNEKIVTWSHRLHLAPGFSGFPGLSEPTRWWRFQPPTAVGLRMPKIPNKIIIKSPSKWHRPTSDPEIGDGSSVQKTRTCDKISLLGGSSQLTNRWENPSC